MIAESRPVGMIGFRDISDLMRTSIGKHPCSPRQYFSFSSASARLLEFFRRELVAIAVVAYATSVTPAQTIAPAPNLQQLRQRLPADAQPRPGHGERLLLQSAVGESRVVRQHCGLGP